MACEVWCVHSCEELNGDPWRECSGCPHEYACSSRSWPDFRSASPHVAPLATAQPLRSAEAAAAAMAIAAFAAAVLACRREPRRREEYSPRIWFSALTCWTASRPASTSTSFALSRVMCGALCAAVFYHRWELGALECMQCVPESCDAELSDDGWLYQHSWLVAALVGAALAVAGGTARRLLAFVALAAWLVHLSHGCSIAPHYPFVTCSILYLGTAPLHADTTRQRSTKRRSAGVVAGDAAALQLVLLRGTLALSYGGGGLAKLVFTPGWADGRFFESIFNIVGFARAAVPRSILFQLARASLPLTWATLAIECGLPAFELAASCSRTLAQARAAVYLLSASMHVVILCVLPLTEVSIGMLAFHAALLHATLNEETREAPAHSKKLLVIWRSVSRIALLAMLSIRSLRCFLLPLMATCERECLGVVLRPAGLGQLFVKAALPLATTSFENWPCVNRQEDTSFDPAVLASQLQLIQSNPPNTVVVEVHGRDEQQLIVLSQMPQRALEWAGGGHEWRLFLALTVLSIKGSMASPTVIALFLCSCSPTQNHPYVVAARRMVGLGGSDCTNIARFWRDGRQFECDQLLPRSCVAAESARTPYCSAS